MTTTSTEQLQPVMSRAEMREKAADFELVVHSIAFDLWRVDAGVGLATLSHESGVWTAQRKERQWRTLYRGTSLEKALEALAQWRDDPWFYLKRAGRKAK